MLSGYADENVKFGIVEGLRRQGMDVVTAYESGQQSADDEDLLTVAASQRRLMLTNDTDFLRLHAEWIQNGRDHSGIVFWAQKMSIGVAIRRILKYALQTAPEDAANRVHFL
jgi:hypothetical protein